MAHTLTREELYELAWTEPMQKLARRLDISDVGLSKVCRRANIPVPERGYWAKLQAGKDTRRPPLPPRGLGTQGLVHFGPASTPARSDAHDETIPEAVPEPSFQEDMAQIESRVRGMVGKVRVARGLTTHLHPAIGRLLKDDERRKQKAAESPFGTWNTPVFDSAFERRRLSILNALFLALDRCGASASTRGRDARELYVHIGDVGMQFTLDRVANRRACMSDTNQTDRNDSLRLEVAPMLHGQKPVTWQDSEGARLEDRVSEVAVGLLVTAESTLRQWAVEQYQLRVEDRNRVLAKIGHDRVERERQEREKIERERQLRLDRLLGEAEAWRRAVTLRAYVQARRAALATAAGGSPDAAFDEWERWALGQADGMDPLSGQNISRDRTND
jgi:hypothetical protein